MRNKRLFKNSEDYLVGYSFLLPDVAGLILFWILPMGYVIYLSFYKWNLMSDKMFVGLKQYITLFHDTVWWNSLLVTTKYVVFFVPGIIVASLLLALMLSRSFKSNAIFRTIYFVPYAMSLVIVGSIWLYLFEPKIGLVNYALSIAGIPEGAWLTSPSQALLAVLFVAMWKYIGFYMIILVAGLQEIPNEYYESAKIDGAGALQSLFHITLPSLKPVFLFVVIVGTISSFEMFDLVYVMTGGGPNKATFISMMYIYETGFEYLNFGYSSAISSVFFMIILIITLVQLFIFRKTEMKGDNA